VEELIKNNIGLQILTDTGWSDFSGLLVRGRKKTVQIQTTNKNVICTLDHKFFKPDFTFVEAQQLRPRQKILTINGTEQVVSIKILDEREVYDLFHVSKNYRFYANGILAKNCEFLIFDETLINASTLLEMQGTDPIEKQGQVRWYHKPKRGSTYVVALDPSLGTGGDAAAIQVVELPACKQVAEWQHNKTDIRGQIRVLKEICNYLYEEIGTQNDIYYSVENNTLGEAALIAISEVGEENIRGSFASEPRNGQSRKYRRGFTTTNKSKLAACAKLKSLIESKKMTISSSNLISELKNFVSHGSSFEAKIGETDDLVMAMILVIRVIQYLQSFDPTLDSYVKDHDEFIEPMPFILM